MVVHGAAAAGWAVLCVGLCGFADTPGPEVERQVGVMLATAGVSGLLAVVLIAVGICAQVTRRAGRRIGVAVEVVIALSCPAGLVILFLPGPAVTLVGTLAFTAVWSLPFAVAALAFFLLQRATH